MGVSNTVQQLSVFLENREGRLEEVLDVLAKKGVNIVALSLADTSDYGMLRLIVSDPHKGRAALKEAGIIKKELNGVKVLGNGKLEKAITVKAHKFSKSAVASIEAAGGKTEVI